MSGPESHMELGDNLNITIERFEDFTNEENGAIEAAYRKAEGTEHQDTVAAVGKLLGGNTEWLQKNDKTLAA